MAIERARTHALPRPWGVVDLMPWSKTDTDGTSIGEIWYERPGKPGSSPSLLLKLLLTSQPLSIQAPGTTWCLDAERETWLLVLSGGAVAGTFDVTRGDAIFAQADRVHIRAGKIRLVGLVACAATDPVRNMLQRLDATDASRPQDVHVLPSLTPAKAAFANEQQMLRQTHRSKSQSSGTR
jgi:hypothetical protein